MHSHKVVIRQLVSVGLVVMVILAATVSAGSEPRTGLPLDLEYFMSQQRVIAQLKLLEMYRVDSGSPNTIAYVVPAPDTDTKNGLFLEFVDDRLIEISSMKTGMLKPLYDSYMAQMSVMAEKWKAGGVQTVIEEQDQSYYLYKDGRS